MQPWATKRLSCDVPLNIPYLAPEIQLLYKAKPETLDKDQLDFDNAVPRLGRPERHWLLGVLEGRFPRGHRWITILRQMTSQ